MLITGAAKASSTKQHSHCPCSSPHACSSTAHPTASHANHKAYPHFPELHSSCAYCKWATCSHFQSLPHSTAYQYRHSSTRHETGSSSDSATSQTKCGEAGKSTWSSIYYEFIYRQNLFCFFLDRGRVSCYQIFFIFIIFCVFLLLWDISPIGEKKKHTFGSLFLLYCCFIYFSWQQS